ncbi:MAG: hypothetical protein GKR89_14220 [Candidatus Latescibacteria bacterium]|nr:hypothetical protein [Candidatus Latescibacterota bacterium]
MTKISKLAALLSLCLIGSASGQFFDPPALADRNGSQGFDFFMLEVPDPNAMTMDGFSDDWGWFDPEFTLTNDEWRDEGDRPFPDRDDLFITTFMGWKGGDVNRWYIFMEAVDDIVDHSGTNVARWQGDMLQVGHDPQDHGRERSPASGYTMEWLMAPGDLSPPTNVAFRYTEQEAWAEYGEAPWVDFAVRVDPPEAFAAELWTEGATTFYEFSIQVLAFQEDAGPTVSEVWQMDAVAGEDGAGFPFAFWYEDGEGPGSGFGNDEETGEHLGSNDMTTRGPEASGRQYYSLARLLRAGEFATSVDESTWGKIKNSF